MKRHQVEANGSSDHHGNLNTLAILALIVGAFTGHIGGLFRLSLVHADVLHNQFIAWAHSQGVIGFLTLAARTHAQVRHHHARARP